MISKGANTFSTQIFVEVISEIVAGIFSAKTQENIMIPSGGCSFRIADLRTQILQEKQVEPRKQANNQLLAIGRSETKASGSGKELHVQDSL